MPLVWFAAHVTIIIMGGVMTLVPARFDIIPFLLREFLFGPVFRKVILRGTLVPHLDCGAVTWCRIDFPQTHLVPFTKRFRI